MLHFLGFLFFILIIIILIGLSVIVSVLRNIFGRGVWRSSSASGGHRSGNRSRYDKEQTTDSPRQNTRPERKKLLSEEEGEYVDFEEIKDNPSGKGSLE